MIDIIKHFFITRLNRLRTDVYIDFKDQLYKDYLMKTYLKSMVSGTLEENQPINSQINQITLIDKKTGVAVNIDRY